MAKRQRLAVRFDEHVWSEAIRGFSGRPLQIATSARTQIQRDDVAFASLLPCEALGPDRTELAGCAKLYLPITDEPPSPRPFAFVLQLTRDTQNQTLVIDNSTEDFRRSASLKACPGLSRGDGSNTTHPTEVGVGLRSATTAAGPSSPSSSAASSPTT